jgi:hypothetical protein
VWSNIEQLLFSGRSKPVAKASWSIAVTVCRNVCEADVVKVWEACRNKFGG